VSTLEPSRRPVSSAFTPLERSEASAYQSSDFFDSDMPDLKIASRPSWMRPRTWLAWTIDTIRENVRHLHDNQNWSSNGADSSRQSDLPSLLPLLLRCKDRSATDDRDKIYALLGLTNASSTAESNSGDATAFSPDYSRPVTNTYMDFTVWYIERYGTLDILAKTPLSSSHKNNMLPSWVMDWSHHGVHRDCGILRPGPKEQVIIAAHRTQIRQLPESRGILLRGYVFDEVDLHTCHLIVHPCTSTAPPDAIQEWHNLALASEHDPYADTEDYPSLRKGRQRAFWQTIFVDAQTSNIWTDPQPRRIVMPRDSGTDWRIKSLEEWITPLRAAVVAKANNLLDQQSNLIMEKCRHRRRICSTHATATSASAASILKWATLFVASLVAASRSSFAEVLER
jgi:hypothetical protein